MQQADSLIRVGQERPPDNTNRKRQHHAIQKFFHTASLCVAARYDFHEKLIQNPTSLSRSQIRSPTNRWKSALCALVIKIVGSMSRLALVEYVVQVDALTL